MLGGGTAVDGGCCCVVDCTTGSCWVGIIWPSVGTDCVDPEAFCIGVENAEFGGGVSKRGTEAVPFCKYATAAEVSPKITII